MGTLKDEIAAIDRAKAALSMDAPPTSRGQLDNKWFAVLWHELTRYDMRESAREARRGTPNIWRLGHLMGAMGKVRYETAAGGSSMEAFRAALHRNFAFDADRRTGDVVAPPH